MEQKEIFNLLQKPGTIAPEQTHALNEVLDEFPYFQAARAVRLKGLKNQASLHYNKELKITAAYTIDRAVLFNFITSEEFNQNEIADQIKKHDHYREENQEQVERMDNTSTNLEDALKLKLREPGEKPSSEATHNVIQPEENETGKKAAKDDLQIGTPLAFQKNESHSFSEWLKLTNARPIDRNETTEGPKRTTSRKFDLIDEFISKSPKIKPVKSGKKINLAQESSTTPEALMTETLARVYLEQKNYGKAMQAYKILILKNPEKSGFFADQIRAIKKIQE